MSQLSKVPAFGFESYKCFAKPYLSEPIKNNLPISDLIHDQPWISQTAKQVKASVVKQNTLKALSYIPGISFGIGIYHLHVARTNKQFSAHFIFRGVLELLGLSFLLLLPDLILKCYREQKAEKEFNAKITSVKGYEDHITKIIKERLKPTVQPTVASEPAPEPEPMKLTPKQQMEAFFTETKRFDKLSKRKLQSLAENIKTAAALDKKQTHELMKQYLTDHFHSEDYKKNTGWQAFEELAAEHGAAASPGVPYKYYLDQTESYVRELLHMHFCSEPYPQASAEKQKIAYINTINEIFAVKSQQQQEIFCLLDKVGMAGDANNAIQDILWFAKHSDKLAPMSDSQALKEVLEQYFASPWFDMRLESTAVRLMDAMKIDTFYPSDFKGHTKILMKDLIDAYLDSAGSLNEFEAKASKSYTKFGRSLDYSFSFSFHKVKALLDTKHNFSIEIKKFVATGTVSEELFNAVQEITFYYEYLRNDIVQGIIQTLLESALKGSQRSLDSVLQKFAMLPYQYKAYNYEAVQKHFAVE